MNRIELSNYIVEEESLEEMQDYIDSALDDLEIIGFYYEHFFGQTDPSNNNKLFKKAKNSLKDLKIRIDSDLCATTGQINIMYRDKYTKRVQEL